jgi:hypothetical protein
MHFKWFEHKKTVFQKQLKSLGSLFKFWCPLKIFLFLHPSMRLIKLGYVYFFAIISSHYLCCLLQITYIYRPNTVWFKIRLQTIIHTVLKYPISKFGIVKWNSPRTQPANWFVRESTSPSQLSIKINEQNLLGM